MDEIIECESKEEVGYATEEDGLKVLAAKPHVQSVMYRVKGTNYNKTFFRSDYEQYEIDEHEE